MDLGSNENIDKSNNKHYVRLVPDDNSFESQLSSIFQSNDFNYLDEAHGEYPYLLYKHHWVSKYKMLEFLALKMNINANLSTQAGNRVACLENMLVNKFH